MTQLKWKIVYMLKEYKTHVAAAAAKSLQLCPTLCDPTDGSPQAANSGRLKTQVTYMQIMCLIFTNIIVTYKQKIVFEKMLPCVMRGMCITVTLYVVK